MGAPRQVWLCLRLESYIHQVIDRRSTYYDVSTSTSVPAAQVRSIDSRVRWVHFRLDPVVRCGRLESSLPLVRNRVVGRICGRRFMDCHRGAAHRPRTIRSYFICSCSLPRSHLLLSSPLPFCVPTITRRTVTLVAAMIRRRFTPISGNRFGLEIGSGWSGGGAEALR